MKLRRSVAHCMLALGTLACSSMIFANASNQGYYRAPALHDQTLVFTAEGDLWTTELSQNQNQTKASRLTSLAAEELDATISKDGKWVAYTANYEGATEVYVMPIEGGVAKRVSFENSRVRLQGWTASGEVLYSTDNAFGPANFWVLKTVDPQTLTITDLPLADAVEGTIDDKGEYVYFTQFGLQVSGDNVKVYRGGAKGEIWRYKLGSKQEAQQLTATHDGSVKQPMLSNGRVYFVSDQSGNDNIWSMTVDGKDFIQHTKYTDWQVRDAQLNNGRIVFQQGADIKLLNLANFTESTLDIELTSDFTHRREQWVNDPMDYATSTVFSHQGDNVVITARSHVAIASNDGRRLVQIDSPADSRVRDALLSDDGKWVYAISDASGEQEIWQYPADGSAGAKQLTKDGSTLRTSLSLSPNGRYLVHDDYMGNVWLYDLSRNNNQKIIQNGEGLGPYQDITWSGDSQFIALTKAEIGKQRPQIVLYSINESKAQTLTSDKYESFSPSFSHDGKWLYFLSNREFKATPDSPWGDRNMGPIFDKRTQVFALALDAKASFPFAKPTELTVIKDAKKDDSKDQDTPAKVKVEWDGLNQRLWQVPVDAGNYNSLVATKDKLYLLDGSQDKSELKLIKFDPLNIKVDTFSEDVGQYSLSKDGSKIMLRKQSDPKNLLIVDAGDKLPSDVSRAKVSTDQWQLSISPPQEWQQIFEDAWLMHRDSFFDPKMRGVDWQAAKAKYQPLVDRLTDRNELNDIFMQMMGELNSLHSQVRGGDIAQDADAAKAAALGARLTQTDKGVVISHIYQTDPELPLSASPLARIEVDAQEGDVIASLNGKKVTNIADVTQLLRNQGNKQVLLGLVRGKTAINTIVTPHDIGTDAKLRYLDWVEHNGDKVAKASKGNIGYLHLYAMGSGDVESFAREFYTNYDKEGLIIDVRRNRGGNIDSWIIEKLLRRAWAFWQPTHGSTNANMQQTFRGHLVVLADQMTYSDGETFSAGIRALNIAPIIGKQTAGAGVWLSGRNSVTDKGMARVAEYPQYAIDGRWIVEGHGVEPDIEVDNLPYATFSGKDAQLEAAISYLKDELLQQPIKPLSGLPIPKTGSAADIKTK
ncbi:MULTISPECIES: S41 family peptidase [Shewanella]|uniref:S41 family peptidase n=1 Tax=Shewanella TaxID=22 RepID=UPI000C3DCC70|nr:MULTISPECIES: S41 family peptidase [Shewanella]NCQ45619.1 peptidase S41 [Shewanella frigidimarina]NCO71756.1 peptidase S41 [Shewanella vesiculosa]NCP37667.1 peptidase S41 [Shewanella vesiculosa]NCP69397.1 peptidase S41 [Shewanella vesiculosa]NCP75288.1 peptidase S41 [Shewanella vesiculosa]